MHTVGGGGYGNGVPSIKERQSGYAVSELTLTKHSMDCKYHTRKAMMVMMILTTMMVTTRIVATIVTMKILKASGTT